MDNAKEAVVKKKSKEIAQEKAAEYLDLLKEEMSKTKVKDFPKAAKALNLEIIQTPLFNRGQYLPQIGISREFQEAAFQLTEENKISDVVDVDKGYSILHLDSYEAADTGEFAKAKEELGSELYGERTNTVFGAYLMQLRNKAQLENNIPNLSANTR